MKLKGELKENVEKAVTNEEKKQLIDEAGMELTDKELEDVTGGAFKISIPSIISKIFDSEPKKKKKK